MKKELLRINRLNYDFSRTRKLENISLCILEGECVGFLGLTYSGKDLLVGLLSGEIKNEQKNGALYIRGKLIRDWEVLKNHVYRVNAINYMIEEWSVAEYVCLVDSTKSNLVMRRSVLEEEAARYCEELELDFDVSCKIKYLTEVEKRIVDFVRAYRRGASLIVIEDEFEGMSREEICKFGRIIRRLIKDRMSVIINSHSNFVLSVLSDKYIIFNKGHIVKKCLKQCIRNETQLNRFLLGGNTSISKYEEEYRPYDTENNIIYSVKNLKVKKGQNKDFVFRRGEVVTLLAREKRTKERLFLLLAGRLTDDQTEYILNGKKIEVSDFSDLTKEKVVSIKNLGSYDEVFKRLTAEENLMLPSLEKLSLWDYIVFSSKIRKMIRQDMEEKHIRDVMVEELKSNELIKVTLERWYIYNPDILVLFEPFSLCDANGVTIVKKYIKNFSKRGTGIIIVNTREEYVEDISDRILIVD